MAEASGFTEKVDMPDSSSFVTLADVAFVDADGVGAAAADDRRVLEPDDSSPEALGACWVVVWPRFFAEESRSTSMSSA